MKKIQDCSVNQIRMLNDDTYILKLNLPLWSNDRKLKEQDEVIVLNTKEIIDLIL